MFLTYTNGIVDVFLRCHWCYTKGDYHNIVLGYFALQIKDSIHCGFLEGCPSGTSPLLFIYPVLVADILDLIDPVLVTDHFDSIDVIVILEYLKCICKNRFSLDFDELFGNSCPHSRSGSTG